LPVDGNTAQSFPATLFKNLLGNIVQQVVSSAYDCKQLNTIKASKDHFKLLCLHLILKSTPIIFNSLSIASNMQVNNIKKQSYEQMCLRVL